MSRVSVRACADSMEWDAFAATVPWATAQHAYGWGDALATHFPYAEMAYSLFEVDGAPVAAVPLVRFTAGGPFRALYSNVFDSYGGPLIAPEWVEDEELLMAIAVHMHAESDLHKAFEIRALLPPTMPHALGADFARHASMQADYRRCPVLDLTPPLDELRGNYTASTRRGVRRSERNGVSVLAEADTALTLRAYPIYAERMNDLGGNTKPWRFLETLMNDDLVVSFVALRNDEPIGIVLLLVFGETAIYWISAATPESNLHRPTNALIDTAIAWSHARGLRHFSFGETPDDRESLVRFKMGWNSQLWQSTTLHRVQRPLVHEAWTRLQPLARRTYSMWEDLRAKT